MQKKGHAPPRVKWPFSSPNRKVKAPHNFNDSSLCRAGLLSQLQTLQPDCPLISSNKARPSWRRSGRTRKEVATPAHGLADKTPNQRLTTRERHNASNFASDPMHVTKRPGQQSRSQRRICRPRMALPEARIVGLRALCIGSEIIWRVRCYQLPLAIQKRRHQKRMINLGCKPHLTQARR